VANLIAPAETVGTVNSGLRRHVGLDGGNRLEVAALTHRPAPDGDDPSGRVEALMLRGEGEVTISRRGQQERGSGRTWARGEGAGRATGRLRAVGERAGGATVVTSVLLNPPPADGGR
jgi:hypothetical protein